MGINVSPDIPDIEYITSKLVTLCQIPSPSGDTKEAVEWVKAEFEQLGYKPILTNKGALLVTIPGRAETNRHCRPTWIRWARWSSRRKATAG